MYYFHNNNTKLLKYLTKSIINTRDDTLEELSEYMRSTHHLLTHVPHVVYDQ